MYTAKTKTNKRIYIDEALKYKDEEYYCPCCDGELIIKDGDINASHFAHKSLADCDDFSHDMSAWHRNWQEQFPEENREVVIEYNGIKHRADVCIGNYVIEFQHSPISRNEFNKRNNFYTNAGYKIVWLFDYQGEMEIYQGEFEDDYDGYVDSDIFLDMTEEEYEDYLDSQRPRNIIGYDELNDYGGAKYRWKHAPKFMSDFIPQYNRDVKVFFQYWSDDDYDVIERVCWAINNYGESDFSRFFTDYSLSKRHFVEQAINNNLHFRLEG